MWVQEKEWGREQEREEGENGVVGGEFRRWLARNWKSEGGCGGSFERGKEGVGRGGDAAVLRIVHGRGGDPSPDEGFREGGAVHRDWIRGRGERRRHRVSRGEIFLCFRERERNEMEGGVEK